MSDSVTPPDTPTVIGEAGKWTVYHGGVVLIRDERGRNIAELRAVGSVPDVLERAYKMAAAPDLYRVVKLALVVSQFGWGTSVSESEHFERMGYMDRLRAALKELG